MADDFIIVVSMATERELLLAAAHVFHHRKCVCLMNQSLERNIMVCYVSSGIVSLVSWCFYYYLFLTSRVKLITIARKVTLCVSVCVCVCVCVRVRVFFFLAFSVQFTSSQ